MTLLQLYLTAEIERTGSISAAAKNLGITQSNASMGLKRLEEELGCTLFVRKGNGMAVTEHGAHFMIHAKRMLSEEKAIRSVCKMESIPRLRIGIMNYAPAGDAFVRFYEEKSRVGLADFSCVSVSFDEGITLLKEHALDLVVCLLVKKGVERDVMRCAEENLSLEIIKDIPISLRLRKGHPLAELLQKEPTIENFSKLSQYPYIDYTNITELLPTFNNVSSHSFGYSYRILVSGDVKRLRMVGTTDAYAIGTALNKQRCEENNIIDIPIGTEMSCLATITRKSAAVSGDVRRYLELFREEIEKQFD